MIITLFFVVLIISGILVFFYEDHQYGYGFNMYTCASTLFGTVGLSVCVILIISTHIGVDNQIEVDRIKRESIEQKYDVLRSQYEDISDISVVQDIAEWNMDVTKYKYWCDHPATSWFYSKKVAQSLELIDK